VTVEVCNCAEIAASLQTLQHAIDGAPLCIADTVRLIDVRSILMGIKSNYENGRDCTQHAVKINAVPICDELLTCPFCGSLAVVDTLDPNADTPWMVSCSNEGSDCAGVIYRPNSYYGTRAEAIAAWNRRVPNVEAHTSTERR